MVLLRADVRRLPDAGAGAGGPELLPGPAHPAGRRRNRYLHPAPEGQAGQPLQRLGRDRISPHPRPHGGRGGRGVATILEMVQHTRLDAAVSAAAIMRQAIVLAIHHTDNRSAFQRRLADQPLMQAVLADLVLESSRRDDAGDAAGRRLRRAARAATRPGGAGPAGRRGREILGLQAHPAGRVRGAGMPWRRRLCGGFAGGAALSRGAGQQRLGRLRQRHLPGCAARHRREPASLEALRGSSRPQGADRRYDAFVARWTGARRPRGAGGPARAISPGGWRWRSPGR